MKTNTLIGLGLIALGAYLYFQNKKKDEPKAEPKKDEEKANAIGYNTVPERQKRKHGHHYSNAVGFEVPKTSNTAFTQYGRI